MVAQRRVRRCQHERQPHVTRAHGPQQQREITTADGLPIATESIADRTKSAYVCAADLTDVMTGLTVDIVTPDAWEMVRQALGQLSTELDSLLGATLSDRYEEAAQKAEAIERYANGISVSDLEPSNWAIIMHAVTGLARVLADARAEGRAG